MASATVPSPDDGDAIEMCLGGADFSLRNRACWPPECDSRRRDCSGSRPSRAARARGLLECFTLACRKIDAKFVSQNHEVASGMAVTFGELVDQLLDAGRGLGDDLFLFTVS
jgi:hypothetical protein